MIDLHMHSNGSDGQYSPTQLMEKAYEEGRTFVSITDHDSVSGIAEGCKIAKRLGMEFVPGIEISVKYNKEMHILGYGINIYSEAIQKACELFVRQRKERAVKIIFYLRKYGFDVTLQEVEEISGAQVIARPHFAQLLLKKGYVNNLREAFDKYLATEAFDKIERPKPSAREGIRIIHEAGGVAVLAHPRSLQISGHEFEMQLKMLIDLGLDGIETYYSKHSQQRDRRISQISLKVSIIGNLWI